MQAKPLQIYYSEIKAVTQPRCTMPRAKQKGKHHRASEHWAALLPRHSPTRFRVGERRAAVGNLPGCSSGWHLWPGRCGLGAGRLPSRPGRGSGCCGSWPSTGRSPRAWHWAGEHSGTGGWALRGEGWSRQQVSGKEHAGAVQRAALGGVNRVPHFGFAVIKVT